MFILLVNYTSSGGRGRFWHDDTRIACINTTYSEVIKKGSVMDKTVILV